MCGTQPRRDSTRCCLPHFWVELCHPLSVNVSAEDSTRFGRRRRRAIPDEGEKESNGDGQVLIACLSDETAESGRSARTPCRQKMLRRNARLRREYIYRKSLEGKEKELYEKKRAVKESLAGLAAGLMARGP